MVVEQDLPCSDGIEPAPADLGRCGQAAVTGLYSLSKHCLSVILNLAEQCDT